MAKKVTTEEQAVELGLKKGFSGVPKEFQTPAVALGIVKEIGFVLSGIPDKLKTPEICLAAVQNEGLMLEVVPDNLKTPEICRAAIDNQPTALRYVPDELKTVEMCVYAMKRQNDPDQPNGVKSYLPYGLKDEVLKLYKESPKTAEEEKISSVPEAWRGKSSEKDALRLVERSAEHLRDIPEEFRTPAVCLAAVQKNVLFEDMLDLVPESIKNAEICLAAVQKIGKALAHVPESLKTAEICLAAVQNDGNALEHVPESIKTAEICLAAVQSDLHFPKTDQGGVLKYVPESLKTAEICLAATESGTDALQFIPEKFMTEEMCLKAILWGADCYNPAFVPEKFRNSVEFWKKAVVQHEYIVERVPPDVINEEICIAAVSKTPSVALKVGAKNLSPAVAIAAVESDNFKGWPYYDSTGKQVLVKSALGYIPTVKRTLEVCIAAVRKNPEAMEEVPASLKPEVKKALGIPDSVSEASAKKTKTAAKKGRRQE